MSMRPHKACDAVIEKIKFPILAMRKIDGVRALHMNGQFGTRNLKPFRNQRLADAYDKQSFHGLDGELAVAAIDHPDLCRRTTSFTSSYMDKTDGISLPSWNLFDNTAIKGPYIERIEWIHDNIGHLQGLCSMIRAVPYTVLKNIDEVNEFHMDSINLGYEGTVLRSPGGMHKSGRCTPNEGHYLRIKDLGDEEAVILELVEAETNLNPAKENELGYLSRSSHQENKTGNGMIGAMTVRIPDGRIIRIGAGNMPHSERRHYWLNPSEIIGKECTYKFMIHGEHEMRRHPRYKCLREGKI